ncbi:E3 ubiquitin-protein ligase CIP8-like [Hibiscus syriacus]|uniref:E3 ubiquitin-protein ligase CIP8-like n=1 Tax=Hibiscus syriacus TaxID=106335 RepID=A0A6A2YY36_HIBSY|nr:E3 ubiquitin-protein ligase CIP8-like [Hibiscus syriacus]
MAKNLLCKFSGPGVDGDQRLQGQLFDNCGLWGGAGGYGDIGCGDWEFDDDLPGSHSGDKAYGLVSGRRFGGGFVLIVSSTVVGFILVGTLTWDVIRKAKYAISGDHAASVHVQEMCKGGICWHGVAVRSPASQVRFRIPQRIPYRL